MLSWVVLRGRCRDCRAAISVRYPLVELGTALLFAAVAWWALAANQSAGAVITLAVFLFLAAASVALALIDLDTHTLPNSLVLPAGLVALVGLPAVSFLVGEPGRLIVMFTGGAGLFLLYLVLALVRPGGMGAGDVKLAGVLGLYLGWLGWAPLLVGAFGAFLLGGLYGIALLLGRRATRNSGIPFGPWMLASAWLAIFWGEQVAAGYLSLFGITR